LILLGTLLFGNRRACSRMLESPPALSLQKPYMKTISAYSTYRHMCMFAAYYNKNNSFNSFWWITNEFIGERQKCKQSFHENRILLFWCKILIIIIFHRQCENETTTLIFITIFSTKAIISFVVRKITSFFLMETSFFIV